ncbi:MAG: histidine--tRNA ligase, partial [Burkholderiales bacterium]|nr:histidine--tRNA ligase [Burkholderiales bacterium]
YDTLVESLGGKPTPACGFGMGMERVLMLMQDYGVTATDAPHVYLVNAGEAAQRAAPLLAERLRDGGLSVSVHAGGGSFKSQMKKADGSGAAFAVILGDDEVAAGTAAIKPLRGQGEQRTVAQTELLAALAE